MLRVIAAISDTHVFSRFGLNPPRFHTHESIDIVMGKGQQKVWGYWKRFCQICDEENVDTVLAVGDLTHGTNPKEGSIGLISPSMDEQKYACTEVLKPLVKDRKFYAWQGTGYHLSAPGNNPEKDICEGLGGKWMGLVSNLRFAPSNRIFNISHGQSSAWVYPETVMGRQITNLNAAMGEGLIPKISFILRAHGHKYIHLHRANIQFLQLPSWLCFEPSRITLRDYGKFHSKIGAAIIRIDDEDRIQVWHFLFDPPPIADEVQSA